MVLLVVDTSSSLARLVLARDGEVLGERSWDVSPALGRQLLTELEGLLGEHTIGLRDIDRIGVHVGPAQRSSALRAGVVTGTLLSFASGAELVPVRGKAVSEMVSEAVSAQPGSVVVPDFGFSASG